MRQALVPQAKELVRRSEERGIQLRLFGSVAVMIAVAQPEIVRPEAKDIDCVAASSDLRTLLGVFSELGYDQDLEIARLFGGERRRFFHTELSHEVDLCLDYLRFSRVLPVRGRLGLRQETIPISDLLLTKFQIHDIAWIDLIDICNLLLVFEPGKSETKEEFEMARIIDICSSDWGMYQLAMENTVAVDSYAAGAVSTEHLNRVRKMTQRVRTELTASRKSFPWKIRNLIGTRMDYWNEIRLEDKIPDQQTKSAIREHD